MNRETTLLLKAQVDQGAADAGVRALQQLQVNADKARASFTNIFKGMSDTAEEIQQLNDAAESISFTGRSLDEATKAADANAEAISNLRQQYIEAADAAGKLKDEQPDSSGGGDASGGLGSIGGLRRTGGALRQLGLTEVGHDVTLLGDLQQVSKEFGVIGESMKGLPGLLGEAATEGTALAGSAGGLLAVLGPLVAAVAAVAIAWKVLISDALDPANKALKEAQESVDAYYSAIGKGTTESLQKQLTDLEAQKKAVDEKVATITNSLSGGFESAKQIEILGVKIGDAGARMVTAAENAGAFGGGVQGVNKDLEDAKKQSDEMTGKIDGLKRAMGASAVAANDAAEAEKKLQDARDQAAEKAIAQASQDEQLKQSGTSKGVEQQIADIRAERAAITNELLNSDISTAERQKLQNDLGDLADRENKLTDVILPAVSAREAEEQAVKDAKKAFDEFTKSANDLAKITAEIGKMQSARATQVAREQADDARNAERAGVEKEYAGKIAAAKETEAIAQVRESAVAAGEQAEQKFEDDKAKIIATEHDSELKAYQNYIEAEKRQTDQANRQRLQTLESAQNDLKNLAASGDVAGFVQRSNQAKLDLKHQTENADAQQQQLNQNFEKQVQAARDAETKQLNDLQITFGREQTARDDAANKRIADIEKQGQQANSESARLERELNDIREQWRRDDLKRQRDLEEQNYEERLQVQEDKQREILAQTGNFFDQWINDIARQAQSVLQQAAQQATPGDNTMASADIQDAQTASDYLNRIDSGGYPTFKDGLDYVPRDNYIASLHQGERVLTAQQNQDYSAGGGSSSGGTVSVTVNNTVGDVATKSMLDEYQGTTISGIKQALKQARGKGTN